MSQAVGRCDREALGPQNTIVLRRIFQRQSGVRFLWGNARQIRRGGHCRAERQTAPLRNSRPRIDVRPKTTAPPFQSRKDHVDSMALPPNLTLVAGEYLFGRLPNVAEAREGVAIKPASRLTFGGVYGELDERRHNSGLARFGEGAAISSLRCPQRGGHRIWGARRVGTLEEEP
jgi:hypothetical protein